VILLSVLLLKLVKVPLTGSSLTLNRFWIDIIRFTDIKSLIQNKPNNQIVINFEIYMFHKLF